MTTQSDEPVSGTVHSEALALEKILAVIEVSLHVPSEDFSDAQVAARGFQYLLAREFKRQQPALALLYDLEFVGTGLRRGSYIFDWKVLVKAKQRVASALADPATAVMLTAVLALPGAIENSIGLWERLFPPVQQHLMDDFPHAPPVVTIVVIRKPDGRDTFTRRGGEFDLDDV
ncbi:hypothetical protein ACNQFN_02635 [Thauera butanivorans]|uniref:hypothetical protein n=1 Tax=Thauera butanivorans TaxID=86174 RepID=UPI003AB70983